MQTFRLLDCGQRIRLPNLLIHKLTVTIPQQSIYYNHHPPNCTPQAFCLNATLWPLPLNSTGLVLCWGPTLAIEKKHRSFHFPKYNSDKREKVNRLAEALTKGHIIHQIAYTCFKLYFFRLPYSQQNSEPLHYCQQIFTQQASSPSHHQDLQLSPHSKVQAQFSFGPRKMNIFISVFAPG